MPLFYLRRLTGTQRNERANRHLARYLAFIAGATNAGGLLAVGHYTSHMSGNTSRLGDDLAQGHLDGVLLSALVLFSFFSGAVTATLMATHARRRHRARYAGALALETVAVAAVLGLSLMITQHPALTIVSAALLGFGMGIQNALVTRLSGAVVRTTHMTGVVTDLGIETVRLAQWFRDRTVGMTLVQRCHHLWRLRGHAELKKLRLHLSIYGSFVTGAVMGPVLYVRFGRPTLLAPLGVLVALVIFDTVIGFREAEHSAHGTNPVSAVPTTPKSAGGTARSA